MQTAISCAPSSPNPSARVRFFLAVLPNFSTRSCLRQLNPVRPCNLARPTPPAGHLSSLAGRSRKSTPPPALLYVSPEKRGAKGGWSTTTGDVSSPHADATKLWCCWDLLRRPVRLSLIFSKYLINEKFVPRFLVQITLLHQLPRCYSIHGYQNLYVRFMVLLFY